MMTIKFESIIHFFLITAVIGVAISYSHIYLFHIALIVLIFSFFYLKGFKIRLKRLPTRIHYVLFLMGVWYFLSIFWSINKNYTLKYLFYIFCGLTIVITMIYYANDITKLKKVFKSLSITFVVEIIISLLESMQMIRLPISPFSPYVIYFGRENKVDLFLSEETLSCIFSMPTGFQWNPNNLAATMVIILPFFLLYKNTLVKYLGITGILIILLNAQSRGNLIAFIFQIILYLLFFTRKRMFNFLILAVIILLFLLIIEKIDKSNIKLFQIILDAYNALILYLSFDYESLDSIGVRHILILNGLNALKDTYYLGVGGGGSQMIQEVMGNVGSITSMHNFWIEILVDSGVFFTIFFVVWYVFLIIKNYKIYLSKPKNELTYYSGSVSLSLSGFALGAISASSVIYLLPMWLLFGFSIATINNYETCKRKHKK